MPLSDIENYINKTISLRDSILNNKDFLFDIETVCKICEKSLRSGGKIILAGNGGSASDAQHIAAELVGRFKFDRPALSSISLATDTSILTAIGNDYGFYQLFSRQIQAHGRPEDVFIGITTSGNSQNIIKAIQICAKMNIKTIAFTGGSGGEVREISDYCLCVPSAETGLIQEVHIMLGHILCEYIENKMFANYS
jgi:D-sedoheptulose 7-phosphate isomerase